MALKMSSQEIDEAKGFMVLLMYMTNNMTWSEIRNNLNVPPQRRVGKYGYHADTQGNKIMTEISDRGFTFFTEDLDKALYTLADEVSFKSLSKLRAASSGTISRPAPQLAKYIAWFCADAGIEWDDSNLTQQEIDMYKTTLLGNALMEAGCFMNTKLTPATQTTSTASTSSASTPRTPGQPPANGYKSTGGHSQDIPNIVGNPGQKIMLSGKMIYITADKVGKNTPRAFITPLKTSGNGAIIKVSKAQAEAIKFGSGNGYTDAQLWFTDPNDADICLQALKANQAISSKYTNMRCAAEPKADPNGYFQVTTDFGPAYIKARVLNEDLDEALAEEAKTCTECNTKVEECDNKKSSNSYIINDIETYDEAFMHNYN